MNTVSRGIRNAFRNMIRTGSIVLILGLSIGLIITMLAARQAVQDKIESVKTAAGNTVTIMPAGVRGFEGGGEALTSDQMNQIAQIGRVSAVTQTLSDRLTSDATDLQSAIEPGVLGERRSEQTGVTEEQAAPPEGMQFQRSGDQGTGSATETVRTFTMPLTVTGVNNVSSDSVYGGNSVSWTSGSAFDASSSDAVAVVGKSLAEKNSLAVGSTFKAYDTDVQVVGIYDAGNNFANNGIFMPLATLQTLSDQEGSVTSATVTVDSLDNIASVTSAVSSVLGDKADVTSSEETAKQLVEPLQTVKKISLYSLIGALIAGAVIILLTMMMIVRERRREIGVMKAIGASSTGIMWQFVVEAVTLTVVGLIVGLGVGVVAAAPVTNSLVSSTSSQSQSSQGQEGGSRRITAGGPGSVRAFGSTSRQTVTNVKASVGASMLLYGLLASLVIAVLGSAIPAYLISKIRPAEAMRSE